MSIIDTINNRHSYRGKYKAIPVPREDLITIMKAGLAAPSGCNKQTTSLIAIDDAETLRKLHEVITPSAGETAPAMICVLTQRITAYKGRCFAVQDYSAAIENMLLTVIELGYQSCWYEGHITDEDRIGYQMARILNVPDDYELVCFLPIGIPESDAASPPKRPLANAAVKLEINKQKALDNPIVVYDDKTGIIYHENSDGSRVAVGKRMREGRYSERVGKEA